MKRDERGAALILVLVLVSVVSLVLLGMLTFAGTSIRTTVELRDQATTASTSDAAASAAINAIRNSTYNNSPGQQCFGGANTMSVNGIAGGVASTVSCSPDPAKVLIQCPSLSVCNRPGSAVLTLGTGGEDGVNVDQPTGSTFRVHGVVFSNSNINIVKGNLTTNTRVYARTTCSGAIVSVPAPPSCNYGATPNPLGDDPNYLPATATVPPYRSLAQATADCAAGRKVITFQPGYYDDAVGLSAIMTSSSGCTNSTFWFTPGTYYFDFHNSTHPAVPAGSRVWTVNSGYLVAGTPVNGAGQVVAQPANPATIPGSCNNPIKDARAVGVQFIFGGDSQLSVKAGKAEICGTYSATRPPVAIYGLKSGAESDTTLNGLAPTSATSTNFSNPTNVLAIDGQFASWKRTGNGQNATGTLSATGFLPASAIPAGSLLKTANVRLVHRHSDDSNSQVQFTVTVTPTGGNPISRTFDGAAPPNVWHNALVPLDVASANSLSTAIRSGYTGAKIDITASPPKNGDTVDLDAIALDLVYTAPALRSVSGCVTATPYTGSGNASRCAMVSSDGSPTNLFYVQGTTYAPKAVLDITLNNATEQVFRFGVVARSLWVKLTGSFSFTGPVIEVPDDSPGFVFSVYLNVYLCAPPGPCATSGTPSVRAKVAFVDADPVTPVAGQRQVSVLSYSLTR
ncbi:hypothetical protein [Actinokineospora sp. HUAS TT18]|uniref:hypothetical protein n=1 Tax=Actinokineospora sp. HUAS TT18 TaxID=3447451 RepID=UPI003F520F38